MPNLTLGVNGAHTEIEQPFIGVGGEWRAVSNGFVGVDGVWREFYVAYTPFTVSVNQTSLTGVVVPVFGLFVGSVSGITVSASPNDRPFTYLWVRVSGAVFSVSSEATPNFVYNGPDDNPEGVYRCIVGDGVTSVSTENVTVNFETLT